MFTKQRVNNRLVSRFVMIIHRRFVVCCKLVLSRPRRSVVVYFALCLEAIDMTNRLRRTSWHSCVRFLSQQYHQLTSVARTLASNVMRCVRCLVVVEGGLPAGRLQSRPEGFVSPHQRPTDGDRQFRLHW